MPLSAAISRPSVSQFAPSDDELRAGIVAAMELGRTGDCRGALARLDPLLPRLAPGPGRNTVQRLRLICLGPAGRVAELGPVQRELAEATPRDGLVRSFGVLLAADAGRFAEAAEQMARLAEDDPASLKLISGESWRGIAQKLSEQAQFALRDRLFVALARADWQPQDRPDLRDAVAQGAIEALLAQKEVDEAGALLARIDMPEFLYAMATERLYEPLWPQIESRLGQGASRAVDHFAAARLEEFARAPEDRHARREAIRSFILLGRYADAAEVAAPVRLVAGMPEDDVVAVRYHAQALAALGKRDEAIERMRGFATLDLARTPQGASGLVALAEMLDEHGEAEQALAAARSGLTAGNRALSEWGKGWLNRTEACALSALGRTAEARAVGDRLKASAERNQAAAVEGLLCLNRNDEAAAIAIKAFATTQGASALADQFQPESALWAPSSSRLRALWGVFLKRPDVKAAFERRARILPRSLWPAREPRPIPRQPTAKPGTIA